MKAVHSNRALAELAIAAALAALPGGCSAGPGVVQPRAERQDPARFEECRDPDGKAAYEAAMVQLQAGNDGEALPLLRRVVERCPEHVPAHALYQDTALHLGGEAAAAMRSYYEALADRAESPVPAFAKARLLDSNYLRSTAVDALLQRHPDFAYGYLAQGRLNRSRAQLGEAVTSLQRALELHPQLLEAHLELAENLVELGRTKEARLPYENYLRGAPNDRATIREFVQLLLYRLDDPGAARPWIDRLLADDPQDEAARMDLAAAEWRSGQPEAALRGYLDVLAQRPDNARAALNIGYLHYGELDRGGAARAEHWPKARKAFLLFLQLVRPEDGHDYFEKVLAVPYRIKEIDKELGPGDGAVPSLDELR